SAVLTYVDRSRRSMPEQLRAGVAVESLGLGAWVRLRRKVGATGDDLEPQLEAWQDSRLDPVRQYVRLLHSLVLFAEHELAPAAAT
ncbi:MAG TPA: hypothetical protein VMQ81_14180, partial [Acidimicrobiia bacterium]|nr:hypothetical protein [Acidimicrobiia bacterium]